MCHTFKSWIDIYFNINKYLSSRAFINILVYTNADTGDPIENPSDSEHKY